MRTHMHIPTYRNTHTHTYTHTYTHLCAIWSEGKAVSSSYLVHFVVASVGCPQFTRACIPQMHGVGLCVIQNACMYICVCVCVRVCACVCVRARMCVTEKEVTSK